MTDYISRETAKAFFTPQKGVTFLTPITVTVESLLATIDNIPSANVREVVLCRDCKYYFKDEDGYEMCEDSEGYDPIAEDGFCAWAVKREADE